MSAMNAAERFGVFMGTLTLLGVVVGTLYLPANRWLLDEFHLARSDRPPMHDSLVVVGIDRKFGERESFPEITPRDYLARLITRLTEEGAQAIALDVIVAKDDSTKALDALVSAIEEGPPTVLPTSLQPYGVRSYRPPSYELVMEPPARFRRNAQEGYITFFGGARPEMKPLTRLANRSYRRPDIAPLQASFALAAVGAFYDGKLPPASEPERRWETLLDILDYPVESAPGRNQSGEEPRLINYAGPVEPGAAFRYISSEDLLSAPVFGPGTFNGKLVVIGITYPGRDLLETPWGPMHGVEVHANIINSLLTKTYLRRIDGGGAQFLTVLLALLPAVFLFFVYWQTPPRWWSAPAAVLTSGIATLLLLWFALRLFDRPSGYVLPVGLGVKVWVLATFASCTLMAAIGHARVNSYGGKPYRSKDIPVGHLRTTDASLLTPIDIPEETTTIGRKRWKYLAVGVSVGFLLSRFYSRSES